jgi:hypothetical protein
MWYRNKKTGVRWNVGDEIAKRLASDHDYERTEAPAPKEPEEAAQLTDSAVKAMNRAQLLEYAAKFGVGIASDAKNADIAEAIIKARNEKKEEGE